MNITLFPHLLNNEGKEYISIETALDRIRNGTSSPLVENIRNEGDKEKRSELKRKLPCLLFGGEFEKRTKNAIKNKSGLIVLDFDDVPNLLQKKQELSNDPYVFVVFISPSGNGLKAVIKVDPRGDHEKQFDALKERYPDVDPSGRDISRVCFESYDPLIFVNKKSFTWYEEKTQDLYIPAKKLATVSESETIQNLLKWWNKNYPAVEGQRNTNLFKLACTLFEFSVSDVYTIVLNESNGLSEKEVETIVQSADRTTQQNGTQGTKQFEPRNQLKVVLEKKEKSEITINPKSPTGDQLKLLLEEKGKWAWNELRQEGEYNGKEFTDQMEIMMYDDFNTYLKSLGATKKLDKDIWKAGYTKAFMANTYHPIKKVFEENKWDGTPRLQEYLSAFHDQYDVAQEYISHFLFGSIERLYNRYQNPVLYLDGKQKIGKSTVSQWLAKPFKGYFKDSGILDPNNKDSRFELTDNFIYSWSEGSGLRRRTMESIKALIFTDEITDRRSYARRPVTLPLLANIIMDTNEGEGSLRDSTGLRRFNTVYLSKIDDYRALDPLQLWLEVYEIWKLDTKKLWMSIDQDKKACVDAKTVQTSPIWDVLDSLIVKTDLEDDGITLSQLHNKLSEIDNKYNRYLQGEEVARYFKLNFGIEKQRTRKVSGQNENCLMGVQMKRS